MSPQGHTPHTLELADELMAMAATIAAATSENGASVIREAAAQLRLLHFAAPAAPDMLAALKACEAIVSEGTLPDWDWVRSIIAKAEGR